MNTRTPRLLLAALVLATLASLPLSASAATRQWTAEQANQWHAKQPWLVGANYGPATAINQLEMWQAESFDPKTIDKELGWAKDLGFNSMRVFLHHLLWEQDREGFLKRMEQFLGIAEKHGVGVMFVLFDSVWDPNPQLGRQRAPRPHLHNSGWVQSPGARDLFDRSREKLLEEYVKGVVGRFKDDKRVHVWDLWNEPDNTNDNSYGDKGSKQEPPKERKQARTLELLKKTFEWAREADPSQPLTSGVWRGDWSSDQKLQPWEKVQLEQSDVISFHTYDPPDEVRRRVQALRRYGRPLLCTEYMARPRGSTFDPMLGHFKQEKIGAYIWGFVAGKTQTIYPWDSWQKQYTAEPSVWFHDVFRPDGRPYDAKEVEYVKRVTKSNGE